MAPAAHDVTRPYSSNKKSSHEKKISTHSSQANTWERLLPRKAVDEIFAAELNIAPPLDYQKAVRDGKIGILINEVWIGVDEFRLKIDRVLGWHQVRSNDFTIEIVEDKIRLRGRGFGHLVGMGQEDAILLAEAGYDYIKILNLFYARGACTLLGADGN